MVGVVLHIGTGVKSDDVYYSKYGNKLVYFL